MGTSRAAPEARHFDHVDMAFRSIFGCAIMITLVIMIIIIARVPCISTASHGVHRISLHKIAPRAK